MSTPAALRIVAVSGSPTDPSRTTALVTEIAAALAEALGGTAETIELAGLREELAAGVWRPQLGPSAREALERVESADVLVVGSPAYRATYTGLFKLFFDHVGQLALVDRPVLLSATAGAAGDAALVEHHLRALFAFFQSRVLPIGVPTDDSGFDEDKRVTDALRLRIAAAVERATPLI
ncbi:NADPH-dependent FMN reductase [Amnibacterium flavum]|uniref:FMN reductase n=1 Tax=Amnibacterium flavum TaxID=2173173 RepID=A0A2V1HQB0_9MICO|nr:NADPH-dependent FMN reductase [Amnibacterium flavum]PVZ93812.1 FMN reductase [Amnibacterium flavum]